MGRPSKYPEEFRREAVALRRSSDRPRCQVAKDLGISDGSLAAWEKEFPDGSDLEQLDAGERAELDRLRKENAELKLDREILRKAAQYFARETTDDRSGASPFVNPLLSLMCRSATVHNASPTRR